MKITPSRILTVTLSLILVISSLVSCDRGNGSEDDRGTLTIEYFEKTDESFFAKMELVSIDDKIYCDRLPIDTSSLGEEKEDGLVKATSSDSESESGTYGESDGDNSVIRKEYLIAGFKVVDNYYGDRYEGDIITVKFPISLVEYSITGETEPKFLRSIDKEAAKELIENWDCVYYYHDIAPRLTLLYSEEGEKNYFYSMSEYNFYDYAFPVADGIVKKADLSSLGFLKTGALVYELYDYSEYFRDGMTEGELIESIERLYREQTEGAE